MFTPESLKTFTDDLEKNKGVYDLSKLNFSEKIDKDPQRMTADQVETAIQIGITRLQEDDIRETAGEFDKSSAWFSGDEEDAKRTWIKLQSLSPEELNSIDNLDPVVKEMVTKVQNYTRQYDEVEEKKVVEEDTTPPAIEFPKRTGDISINDLRTNIKDIEKITGIKDPKLEEKILTYMKDQNIPLTPNNIRIYMIKIYKPEE